jgi:pimeloyl-ACP methyl ester carboxylesterase
VVPLRWGRRAAVRAPGRDARGVRHWRGDHSGECGESRRVERARGSGLLHDQLPFQFRDALDPRIAEFEKRTAGGVNSPEVLRQFANADYGGIEVENRLGAVTQPVLVLAGRFDRTCVTEGAEAIAKGLPHADFVVFEDSAHMTYVEENEKYVKVVREFLNKNL